MQLLIQILLVLLLIIILLGDWFNYRKNSFDKLYDTLAYDDLVYTLGRSGYKKFIQILNAIVALILLAFVWLLIEMAQSFSDQYEQLKNIFQCVIIIQIVSYFVSLPVVTNTINAGPKNKYHGFYVLNKIANIAIDACYVVALIVIIMAKMKGLA